MKHGQPSKSATKRLAWQVVLAVSLVAFPVAMLLINGSKALKGILWEPEPSAYDTRSGYASPAVNAGTKSYTDTLPFFGVYDPQNQFDKDTLMDAEHIYFSWLEFDDRLLINRLVEIGKKKRFPVITIEPWSGNPSENLMTAITVGEYDEIIRRIALCLKESPAGTRISWGHEMDQDLTKRYPWSGVDPKAFIAAYRYFADKVESESGRQFSWIWAPVGKKGCAAYWPGDSYVDAVGFPLYSFPAYDRKAYGYIRSFSECISEKYAAVAGFGKPVIVVEMGVEGDEDFRAFWLHDAFMKFPGYRIAGILFFNSADTPGAWGSDLPTPDWRGNQPAISALVGWVKQQAGIANQGKGI